MTAEFGVPSRLSVARTAAEEIAQSKCILCGFA